MKGRDYHPCVARHRSKPEDEMAPGRIDERTKALFADAERRAERVIGQLRMAMALSLGAVFAIAVITHAQRDDAVLPVQITVASATILAY
jgi:adenylate cyclase